MQIKFLIPSLMTGLLLGAYPVRSLVSAQQPTQPTQTRTTPTQIAQAPWKQFSSQEGRFTVLMPGTPVQGKQTQTTAVGPVDVYTFTVPTEQRTVAYIASYADFPAELARQANPKLILNNVRDGMVRGTKGKLLSDRDITLGGIPGKEIRVEAPGNYITSSRMYLVGPRLYQLVTATPKTKADALTNDVNRFLTSFKLL